ncbi:hypothetical protein BCR35DRAFT_300222 [Leucosporidium creatinivorum]|uniref:BZIP domain-containing protein n=1 Tax=Leucosporidium creatinivorum TaxID=106004 RepID=A0A1Y2G3Z4_9BASI|nr:hypothetical protein BCR35DRAFT_300222 [Leucosporidium creatinivorum]
MEDFLNLDSFDSAAQPQQQQQPVLVAGQDETNGMSFTELFQHYLAPEVAKLPNQYASSLPSTSTSHPFAPENDLSPASAASSFDPTAYLPTIPGSPIGGFSPSSDNSGQRYGASMSPLSFADLDAELQGGGNDWAIDPSFFGGEAPVVTDEPQAAITPSTATSTATLPAVLPPLPLGPIVNQEQPATIPAVASTSAPVTRPHPKRHLSASVTGDDEEDDEAFDSDASDASAATSSTKRRPSAAKKQKAASGKAKTPKTSVAAFATPTLHHTSSKSTLAPVPEWTDKPDPETYKKLNSKEKRQLRNKISARNFRHRRKEHLQTLEEEISSRDTIISQLRDEVGVMRTENSDLRGEVSMLKQKWDEMMEKMTSFAVPPAIVPSTSAAGLGVNTKLAVAPVVKQEPVEEVWALDSPQPAAPESLPTNATASTSQAPVPTARRAGTRGANGIAKPNLSKDVAPGMGRRTGSWTTAGGMGGGFTSVHTTLLPEFNLSNKLISSSPSSLFSGNFNPALNHLSASQQAQLPALTSHLRAAGGLTSPPPSQESSAHHPKGTFEDFFQSNPFWLRSDNVEEYRASLYGKLAHNAAGAQAAQKLQQANGGAPAPGQHLPLPQGFRPAFFSSSSSTSAPPPPYSPRRTPSSLDLGGKEEKTASDLLAFQSPSTATANNQNNAYIATLATQTLFSRMASAFVDAFAGAPEPSGAQRKLSGEKVASVLAGTSRLQVVPNASAPLASPALEGLELSLGSLSLGGESPAPRNVELGGGSGACSFEEMRRRWRGGRKTSQQGEETSS